MTETHETIADIIAEMRDEGHTGESSCLEWVGAKMRCYADRLEAALKRERGDCAKLREALLAFVRAYEQEDEMSNIEDTAEAYELARSALAETKCNMN